MGLDDLHLLGFSEYEARVYAALLTNPDSTGYEIAGVANVPRAKVYEVLSGLERKGIVLTSGDDKRRCYHALPGNMLVDRYRRQTKATLDRLSTTLTQLEAGHDRQLLRTIRGRQSVLDLVRQLIDGARCRIHICGLPAELQDLAPALKAARQRGVKEYILSYGPTDLPGLNVVAHRVSATQYLQVAALGHWLGIVVDFDQAVLAQVRDEEDSQAMWSNHPGIMFGIFSWIAHDITMYKFEQLIPEIPDISKVLAPIYDELEPMWLLDAHEGPILHHLVVDEGELAESLKQGVARYRGRPCTIQFHLSGEGGGDWLLRLHANGGIAESGKSSPADLVVRMSARDFYALHLGQLPLTAFLTQDRISVSGDLDLAGKLQGIIQGRELI